MTDHNKEIDDKTAKELLRLILEVDMVAPLLRSLRDMSYLSGANRSSILYQSALITGMLFNMNLVISDPRVEEIAEVYRDRLSRYEKEVDFFLEVFGKDMGMLMYGFYINYGKRWNIPRFLAHVEYLSSDPSRLDRLVASIDTGKPHHVFRRMY